MKVQVNGRTDIIVASDITIKNLKFMHLIELKKGYSLIDKIFNLEEEQAKSSRTAYESLEVVVEEIIVLDREPITESNQG